jgi:hypothetical protein
MRKHQHPPNALRRHLCSPLRIELVPLGENGPAVKTINRGNQAGSGLGLRDPLELAFAAQVPREFCEHVEHFEEAIAACGAGVGRLEGAPPGADCADDVL